MHSRRDRCISLLCVFIIILFVFYVPFPCKIQQVLVCFIIRNSDSMLKVMLLKVIVVQTGGQIWRGLVGLVENALRNIQPWKVHSVSLEKCQWVVPVGHTLGREAKSFPHCPLLGKWADCFPYCDLPKQSVQPFGIGLLSEASWLEQISYYAPSWGWCGKRTQHLLPRNLCAEVLHELNISEQKDLHMKVSYPLMFLCS